jgi:hypothetical protein
MGRSHVSASFSFLFCQNVIGFVDLGPRVPLVRILALNSSVALFKLSGHIVLLLMDDSLVISAYSLMDVIGFIARRPTCLGSIS